MSFFGIHPEDKDLNFLRKLNDDLVSQYSNYTYYRLRPNYDSHQNCLAAMRRTKDVTAFIFCHALEKSLRGCKIESNSNSNSHRNYTYGNFISPNLNIDVFKDKKILCLACNSKDLGSYAINAGAQVFLGFGEIPFYLTENFKEQDVINLVKENLRNVMYNSIVNAIDKNHTFNQLSVSISTSIDIAKNNLLLGKARDRKSRIDANRALSKIKQGITMFGDGTLTVGFNR